VIGILLAKLFVAYIVVHVLLLMVRTWLPHPRIRPFYCKMGWHSRQKDRKLLATSMYGQRHVLCQWCGHTGYETRFGDMRR
jgi:hypothetical protein